MNIIIIFIRIKGWYLLQSHGDFFSIFKYIISYLWALHCFKNSVFHWRRRTFYSSIKKLHHRRDNATPYFIFLNIQPFFPTISLLSKKSNPPHLALLKYLARHTYIGTRSLLRRILTAGCKSSSPRNPRTDESRAKKEKSARGVPV